MAGTSASPNPVKGETTFSYKEKDYTFTFPWDAVVAFESATNFSFAEFLAQIEMAQHGGRWPLVHHLGEFMRAGLSTHHPDVTAEFAAEIVFDEVAKKAAVAAVRNSMPEEGGSGSGEAKAVRGRSGGSKTSSASGSKRAAKKKRSGKPRPG